MGRRSEPQVLFRWREDYYPSGSLIAALKRQVSAAGGEVREWDEGRDMYVGIYDGPRMDRDRLSKIAWAYSKAKRYFGVGRRRGEQPSSSDPYRRSSFEIESDLALEDFNRRLGSSASAARRSSPRGSRRSCRSPRTGRYVRC